MNEPDVTIVVGAVVVPDGMDACRMEMHPVALRGNAQNVAAFLRQEMGAILMGEQGPGHKLAANFGVQFVYLESRGTHTVGSLRLRRDVPWEFAAEPVAGILPDDKLDELAGRLYEVARAHHMTKPFWSSVLSDPEHAITRATWRSVAEAALREMEGDKDGTDRAFACAKVFREVSQKDAAGTAEPS